MNVVGHDFDCDYLGSIPPSSLTDDLLATGSYRAFQDFAPVFRAPHNVVFAAVDNVVVRLVSEYHDSIIWWIDLPRFTACCSSPQNTKSVAPMQASG
jgi:hypothetical protein